MQLVNSTSTDLIEIEADELVSTIESVKVTNLIEYQEAAAFRKQVRDLGKKLEAARLELTRPLDDHKKAIMDRFRVPQNRLADADEKLKQGILAYDRELERIRREEEVKLRAIAEREAAEARKRLEEEAVKVITETGDITEAESIVEASIAIVPEVVELKAPDMKWTGVSHRALYRYRVTDINAVPREYLVINEQKLAQLARDSKGSATVPGIEFYEEKTLVQR
jgi:hypothetical protein